MKETARKIFDEAVSAVNPYHAVANHIDEIRDTYNRGAFKKLYVIGFGNASVSMAQAVEDALHELITDGVIITKHGHYLEKDLKKIKVCEASHPVPCCEGVAATDEIVRLVEAADETSLVVTLISGGGSALFLAPVDGVSLAEKQQVTSLLLHAGANINELNCVRKLISKVKGGGLTRLIWPATNISLILSDVMGDPLDVIASGPTTQNPSSFKEALAVLEKFDLLDKVPASVLSYLKNGITVVPKQIGSIFEKTKNIIIASNSIALEAAKQAAIKSGLNAEIVSAEISGEARDVGAEFARRALELKKQDGTALPMCLISGGETTVTVKGSGKGGRNMEMALAFAMHVAGTAGITLLSAGTDGNDGPTDATGGIVDGETVPSGNAKGIDAGQFIDNNDSYNYLKLSGGLLITGPTGTNVMDIQVMIVS